MSKRLRTGLLITWGTSGPGQETLHGTICAKKQCPGRAAQIYKRYELSDWAILMLMLKRAVLLMKRQTFVFIFRTL